MTEHNTKSSTGQRHISRDTNTNQREHASGLGRISSLCKLLLLVSILLMGAGIALPFLNAKPAHTQQTHVQPGEPGAIDTSFSTGLAPESETLDAGGPALDNITNSATDYSPAMFRAGFSFFAGFSIALALKLVLRTALVFAGFFILGMFGLQYAGIAEVNWTLLGDKYDTLSELARSQISSFQTFITGYLPSTAATGAGLFLGFRGR